MLAGILEYSSFGIIFLCVSLAVCLSKITASENEPSVFSLIQRAYSYYVSVFILLCVCV